MLLTMLMPPINAVQDVCPLCLLTAILHKLHRPLVLNAWRCSQELQLAWAHTLDRRCTCCCRAAVVAGHCCRPRMGVAVCCNWNCRAAVVVSNEGGSALHNAGGGSVVDCQLGLGQGAKVLLKLGLQESKIA